MRRLALLPALCCLVAESVALGLPAARAGETAHFIDGTYTFAPGACAKLKALAAGGPQGVTSVPWHVTPDGISFWEGGCSFDKISKGKRANEWRVVASCNEEVEEFTESYLFRRAGPGKFSVTLTTPGTKPADAKPKLYTRCDVGPIAEPQ